MPQPSSLPQMRYPTALQSAANNNFVVGQGGFGVVMRNRTNGTLVHKLMKSGVQCHEAEKEYDNHRRIYETYAKFVKSHPTLARSIAVPKPHVFMSCKSCRGSLCHVCTEPYHCVYTMDGVVSGRRDGLMEHVILNEIYENQGGQIYFVNHPRMPNSTYVNAAKKRMGPRGAFLAQSQLAKRNVDVREMARNMGMLFQIIIAAGVTPHDAEYVLGMPPPSSTGQLRRATTGGGVGRATCLWAMDFGMAHKPYTADDMEMDMYVPSADDDPTLHAHFLQGRAVVREWQSKPRPGLTRSVTR